MIERQQKNNIIKLLKHFPCVGIIGPRQIGKTTLAKNLIPFLKRKAIYLDLESPSDLNKLENAELYFDMNKEKCIIIDEIQRKPELFSVLRSVIDKNRKAGRFILLGSSSPDLIKNTSETLAGRITYIELTGLNTIEINEKYNYYTHLIAGGFPEPLTLKNKDIRKEWFSSFIKTYIERDLRMFGLNASPSIINRFIIMLANNQGALWNASSYSKALGISVPSVINIVDYLENAFLVRKLLSYSHNPKKRIIKAPKIYIRDNGILHYLTGINSMDSLMGNVLLGASWENYIIEQITSVLGNAYQYYFYRTQDGTECDLIITENLKPISCVEIKFSQNPSKTKSLTTAIQDIKTKNNFIIIPVCNEHYNLSENVTVCDIVNYFNLFKKNLKT